MPDDLSGVDFGAYLAGIFEEKIAPGVVCRCCVCGAEDFIGNDGAPGGWLKLRTRFLSYDIFVCDTCNKPVPRRTGPYR